MRRGGAPQTPWLADVSNRPHARLGTPTMSTMSRIKENSSEEIDAFEAVCNRLAGFDERISAEWADGYMTALLSGPRTMGIEEWLPVMAGDAFERAFSDPQDVAQALQALGARWQAIASELDPERLLDDEDALRLNPLMSEWGGEEMRALLDEERISAEEVAAHWPATGELWALGFLDAVEDFCADWPDADLSTDAGQHYDDCLSRIIALTLEAGGRDLSEHLETRYAGKALTRDQLVDEACFAAQDLRLHWLHHAPRPATRRVDKAPGRNDPCPCGSGKKYKRCHGAS